ncbi:MAG: DUF4389 domain-containing protein [Dehalococcoidia bacterium]|nr:DUF4389 domain-containing protein [Dehalococcoidia bacterium]
MSAVGTGYPLSFDVEYPERLSRWLIFVKWLLVLPHWIIVGLLGFVAEVMTVIAWFAILFTGRYPKGLFDFVVGVYRWSYNASVYPFLMRDEYPPFSMSTGQYPLTYEVEYPERLSRWLIFVKWLLVLPHLIVLSILSIVYLFTVFVAWFAILFTGRYPRGLFDFAVGYLRWSARVNAYFILLRDEYPPFSLRP